MKVVRNMKAAAPLAEATNRTEAVVKVAGALASPRSYTYTISSYTTLLHGSPLPMPALGAEECRPLND
jgi:hypothetical protein